MTVLFIGMKKWIIVAQHPWETAKISAPDRRVEIEDPIGWRAGEM
jgi:hypothetical protein